LSEDEQINYFEDEEVEEREEASGEREKGCDSVSRNSDELGLEVEVDEVDEVDEVMRMMR